VNDVDLRLERGRATRQRLVDVATDLFAVHGYEATSIEAVLEASQMSRGSLYHHFSSKQALFEAVVDAVEARAAQTVVAATSKAASTDPVAVLRAAFLAWVGLAADPVVRRVLLIDAPAVVGWRRWREIEEQYGLGMIKAVLQAAANDGRLPAQLVGPFAHMLLAVVNEAALLVALADDVPSAEASAKTAVNELLSRLLPPVGAKRRAKA
jgi:AcrR family transcriptional regulator